MALETGENRSWNSFVDPQNRQRKTNAFAKMRCRLEESLMCFFFSNTNGLNLNDRTICEPLTLLQTEFPGCYLSER